MIKIYKGNWVEPAVVVEILKELEIWSMAHTAPLVLGVTTTRTEIEAPSWAAEASRLAALLVGHMHPACSLLAPCRSGRLGAHAWHLYFCQGPKRLCTGASLT